MVPCIGPGALVKILIKDHSINGYGYTMALSRCNYTKSVIVTGSKKTSLIYACTCS